MSISITNFFINSPSETVLLESVDTCAHKVRWLVVLAIGQDDSKGWRGEYCGLCSWCFYICRCHYIVREDILTYDMESMRRILRQQHIERFDNLSSNKSSIKKRRIIIFIYLIVWYWGLWDLLLAEKSRQDRASRGSQLLFHPEKYLRFQVSFEDYICVK